jgi:hypothetical protein
MARKRCPQGWLERVCVMRRAVRHPCACLHADLFTPPAAEEAVQREAALVDTVLSQGFEIAGKFWSVACTPGQTCLSISA